MARVTTKDGTELYYNDWGQGRPVVLVPGWPLDADMWSDQAVFLAENGFRAITYDRRGFGRSSQPWTGYDYDTLADDLAAVLDHLDLSHVTLVGFSMGGGEVARYLARHGSARIAKAVLVSAVTPYLLKTNDNPTGVDPSVFDQMIDGLRKDRPHFLAGFAKGLYGNGLVGRRVSDEVLQWSLQMAMMGSLRATIECVKAFSATDFRADMAAFTVPTLIIHGTSDASVPIDHSGRVAAKMIPSARLVEYDGEPHGLFATAKDRLNADLAAFAGA
ncbi:alpha/beta hydrolase [Lichenihabitans sp. PAMC28606]|uniref:alpha/beta fold hydrolase n=1 Tax=Lichenihabitans sp. PAMC28606 TaxID=2880932 RepID=UPI001D0A4584|nr:alpha/beta hydrolase [Lichenihabitans sp. PAMC28606]UDL95256.1 alpha/beta hydrolase [Lichenihabitans sp. PAMC28606]